MRPTHPFGVLTAALPLLLTVGCQPTVYLMPTPEALSSGRHDPFSHSIESDNRTHIAYATNRLPVGPKGDRAYLTLFDDNLRLGFARIRIGGEDDSGETLRFISTTRERQRNFPLTLEAAEEQVVVPIEATASELSPEARGFFDDLNDKLARSLDPDLTLYVHGANNNFYRASALAGQLRHFSGSNSLVMLYAWPSAESLLRYAVDVNNARETVPMFARLLELLAQHTNARHIDILAYSAGAQIVSPALALLREQNNRDDLRRLKERLRLGEIYFAAPDLDFKQFLEDVTTYLGLTSHVTLALNPHDTVLGFAAKHHGNSRAGRPDRNELTEEETRWILAATRHLPIDVIWIDPETMPGMSKGAHDFWYSHPWVSTDTLLQLLFQARPADRGLEAYDEADKARVWYFPADYPDRITPAIDQLKETVFQSGRSAERPGSDQ